MNRPINTALLGTTPDIKVNTADGIFMFNNRNLDNGSTIRVISSNHDDIGTIDFPTYDTPLEDGGGVLGKYYRKKIITLFLSITADSEDSLNDLIDELKYQTSQTEGNLKIVINGVVRERTATCTSLKFNRKSYDVNHVGNVSLTFTCVNPHSHLENPSGANIVQESGTYNGSIMYSGRAETYPTLLLTIDSGSSSGMRFTLNGYTIQITTSLTVGDIIIFDGERKTVSVNGTEVKYTGPFTPLTYGENLYTIVNDGTYTGTLTYFINYL